MYKYQLNLKLDNTIGNPIAVIRLLDNAVIPFDNNNTDYQEYLEWVAEGGVVEPADE